ncbi:MAG: glycoside hydrolase family 28 protein [Pirellulales bacterium]|nr:glycoside hydrolase family 28 protein [Pirellulales bacterium]
MVAILSAAFALGVRSLKAGTVAAGLVWAMLAGSVSPATADDPGEAWAKLDAVLASIVEPEIPKRDFAIAEHGAQPTTSPAQDDITGPDSRDAIQAAIEACHAAGGGRVVVPAGRWFVKGPLRLRSKVDLHLQKDAVLLFSNDPNDFLPVVLTRFEGVEVRNFSPPIYAYDEHDVALTGEGAIDGRASDKNWWKWKGSGNDDVARLNAMSDAGKPPEERVFGAEGKLRVNFVQPYRCRNVLIEGITILRSPMWVMNPVLCENVTVRNVTVVSHGPNNDGCNPESCRNVLIEGCLFDTGDDCIAIKSGRNADGRRINVPSENICVRNCRMKDGHGGVTLGSEMSGGIRNVWVENCEMDSPQLDRAIRLKSNLARGGYLQNMYVRNVRVGQVADAVVHIDLRYFRETGNHPPVVSNIHIENVTAEKSKRPLYLMGTPESPITGVTIANCRFAGAAKPSILEDVVSLHLLNYSQPE